MSKYFLSFTSTFESLLAGKLTIADLATGILVFGCKREHILLPYDLIPIEVTLNNKVKPKQAGNDKVTTVTREKVDHDVLKAWDAFAAQVRRASTEGRLIWMHDIGHPSYRHFSQDVVREGHQAFWKGSWVTLEQPASVLGAAHKH